MITTRRIAVLFLMVWATGCATVSQTPQERLQQLGYQNCVRIESRYAEVEQYRCLTQDGQEVIVELTDSPATSTSPSQSYRDEHISAHIIGGIFEGLVEGLLHVIFNHH